MIFKNYDTREMSMRLAAHLKEQRIDAGLSQRDLGKKLGCTHTFVSKVENGERRITVPEYIVYCKAMNISYLKNIEFLL